MHLKEAKAKSKLEHFIKERTRTQVRVPRAALKGVHEVFLRINYTGDIGRAYLGDRLISDDFYVGRVWEIGLKRFSPEALEKGLTLKVLPLRKDAPVLYA
jgi:beta-galactosidase